MSIMGNSAIPSRMGRKQKWTENTTARFAEGTFARIEAVLGKTEDRTDFMREAVERELARRAEATKKPAKVQKRR
jgi:hypothetical protein